MEDQLLKHSGSADSLFNDLKQVVSAPKPLLSHLVGSRTKEDRDELKRILTHLPVIREVRANRAAEKAKRSAAAAAPQVLAVSEAGYAPKAGSAAGDAPKQAASRGATPREPGTPRSASYMPSPSPLVGPLTSRGGTPRVAATPRGGSAGGASAPVAPPGATPRTSRGATPRLAGAAVVGAAAQASSPSAPLQDSQPADKEPPSDAAQKAAAVIEEAQRKAMELRGEKQVRRPEDEKKSQAEATQRVIEKLAELGIDPEGMSATDILRIFYARGSGSSYWLANREAEKRLNIRASTPKSFSGVLKPRAEREIRRARDLPVTNVHEYLDQWEIAFLGDICRSLRCFDEAAEGNTTEYMNKYTQRQYGAKSGRKNFNRPPT